MPIGHLKTKLPQIQSLFFKKSLYFWLATYFIIQLIGQIPATIWVLFTQYRFDWNTTSIGMSLAVLGVLNIFFQAIVAGKLAQNGAKNHHYDQYVY